MNLAQMRTAVSTRLGAPVSDTFYTPQSLTDFVNEALQATNNEDYWPWTQATVSFNTVAGTAAYGATAVPADWKATKALFISGYQPLTLAALQDVDQITTQGMPAQYTVFGDQIILSPTPDAVYSVTHQYQKQEPALSSDTDTPLMPSEFHYAIVAFAAHLAHIRSGEVDYYRGNITGKAAASLQEYSQWITRMRSHRRRSTAMLRPRIRPGGWL